MKVARFSAVISVFLDSLNFFGISPSPMSLRRRDAQMMSTNDEHK
jgi:hypothetical protein